jgi:DNA-binding GntR family transcriptional regulator
LPASDAAREFFRSQFFVLFFVAVAAAAVLGLDQDRTFRPPVRSDAVAASMRYLPATQPADLAELRLLVELPALRRLADRGLSDAELKLATKLADTSMRTARSGDVLGYLRADTAFHQYLLELAGVPALSDLARLLLVPDRVRGSGAGTSGLLMAREAGEHAELVGMFSAGLVSAADHLLRLHLSRLRVGWTAVARLSEPESTVAAGA